MKELLELYPQDVTQGSPFDTGDVVFQAPRRSFLEHRSGKQSTWSYRASLYRDSASPWPDLHLAHPRIVSKRLKNLPVLGSAHASDLLYTYSPGELMDYLIHFATNLDPNGGLSPRWPQYTNGSPQLMTLLTPNGTSITQDTYRADALGYLTKLFLANVTVGL